MKSFPYKTARVIWLDACHWGRQETITWFQENAKMVETCTVGYLIHENKDIVVLAQDIVERSDARDVSIISKEDILKIEYLEIQDGKEKIK